MRIPNPNLDPTLAAQQQARPEGSNRVTRANVSMHPAGSNAPASSGDQTQLGSSVVGLTAGALAQPDVRAEMVQQLRAQIANGTYVVDATQTAGAMLDDPQTGLGSLGRG